VHGTATLLLPLAAEKSKVPFYIAGGLLATWALIASIVLGLRHASFPGGLGGERAVIAITTVLVAVTIAMAVVTSGSPAKKAESAASVTTPAAAPAPSTTARAAGTPAQPSSGTAAAPSPAGALTALALAADPNALLSFNTKQLSAKAGTVKITLTNASSLEHNVTVSEGSKVLGATPTFIQGTRTLTLTLTPGSYTFYCSVPGHRQGGMEGTLSVT
jgi:plastocyanin